MFSYPRRRHYSLQINLPSNSNKPSGPLGIHGQKKIKALSRTKNEQIPTPIDLNEAKNASQPMPPVIMPCKAYPKTHSARYGDGESHEYPSSLISRDARTGPLPPRV